MEFSRRLRFAYCTLALTSRLQERSGLRELHEYRLYDCESMLTRNSSNTLNCHSLAGDLLVDRMLAREGSSTTGASNLISAYPICTVDIAPLEVTPLRYHFVERMSRLPRKACLQMSA